MIWAVLGVQCRSHNLLDEHMALVAARGWRCLFSKGCNSGKCGWCHGARAPRRPSIASAASTVCRQLVGVHGFLGYSDVQTCF